jgi:spermidine synthase
MWSMACASKTENPLSDTVYNRITHGIDHIKPLKYYNADLHKGAFALPNFVADVIER